MRQFIPANAPVTVYAPASMGNVGVGFDLLGAALAPIDGSLLGDTVTVGPAPCGVSLTQLGPWLISCHRSRSRILFIAAPSFS